MYKELTDFAARMGALVSRPAAGMSVRHFSERALELFGLQYAHNAAYRQICDARGVTPKNIPSWTQIPAVPTAAFKELDLTCLAPRDRKFVFYSSGTTGARASRHFHNTASMKLYELSLWHWFECHFDARNEFLFLTPPAKLAPNSSLVHMFEIVRKKFGRPPADFTGQIVDDGWSINFPATIEALERACAKEHPVTILGTAFSFVHLLDHLAANKRQFQLPLGSLVMETGGYKNRSRALPKAELHALITKYLAVMEEDIICEYGMSELSSQAYDRAGRFEAWLASERCFRFPHWAVAQIISPETGQEVAVGETGLIRVFDLANVFSVVAVQTEDLGVRRQNGFELVGRAKAAELRGCSLTSI
jgi:hypothetical protein